MKVLLAEGRKDVRSALRLLLEQESGLSIEAEVTSAKGLLAHLEKQCPDLLLLDWDLSGLRPADLLSSICCFCPELKVIALSSRPESRKEALEAGADIFVSKTDAPECLLDALDDFLCSGT